MATSYSVIAVGPAPGSSLARKLQSEISAVIAQIETRMSIFEPESDISRFNASSTTEWFPVAPETAEVVEMSIEVSRETGGAFDATVEPAVELWGFGAGNQAPPMLSSSPKPEAVAHIDYRRLAVRNSPPALRKSEPHIRLDLSGIAKGYAVDRVAMMLDDFKVHNYMVEIGGEVRTAGFNADGSSWSIGIEAPPGSHLDRILRVTQIAVATSGDYRNAFISDGRRISHIIDPKTGIPAGHDGASVTVVGKQCTRVDARSTALAVLGPDKGYDLAVEKGWAAYFLLRRDSAWSSRTTPAFAVFLNQKPDLHPDNDQESVELN